MLGLLIDLERKLPDATRHEELKGALTSLSFMDESFGEPISLSLDYIHFSEMAHLTKRYERYDFVILSPQGSPWNSYIEKFGKFLAACAKALRNLVLEKNVPTLGICGGHQFLALAFGGKLGFIDNDMLGYSKSEYPENCVSEKGLVSLKTLADDPIFDGITRHPGHFSVIENHIEEIKVVPEKFVNLASSKLSEFQLIRLPGKTVYGVAFHPERGWITGKETSPSFAPHGKTILLNFLKMAYVQKNVSRVI